MDKYTTYCTQVQTKKALELGAPICRIPIGGRDGSKPSYFTKQLDEEGWAECPAYYIPTAEQMIAWLEEYDLDLRIKIIRDKYAKWTCSVYKSYEFSEYKSYFASRPEATLAAVDAALDYLIKNKK